MTHTLILLSPTIPGRYLVPSRATESLEEWSTIETASPENTGRRTNYKEIRKALIATSLRIKEGDIYIPWCLLKRDQWSHSCLADNKTSKCVNLARHDGQLARCVCMHGSSSLDLNNDNQCIMIEQYLYYNIYYDNNAIAAQRLELRNV